MTTPTDRVSVHLTTTESTPAGVSAPPGYGHQLNTPGADDMGKSIVRIFVACIHTLLALLLPAKGQHRRAGAGARTSAPQFHVERSRRVERKLRIGSPPPFEGHRDDRWLPAGEKWKIRAARHLRVSRMSGSGWLSGKGPDPAPAEQPPYQAPWEAPIPMHDVTALVPRYMLRFEDEQRRRDSRPATRHGRPAPAPAPPPARRSAAQAATSAGRW